MARTTLNIDAPVLQELKRLSKKEGKSLGRLVSDLLLQALPSQEEADTAALPPWHISSGDFQVDLLDKDAVYVLLDEEQLAGSSP